MRVQAPFFVLSAFSQLAGGRQYGRLRPCCSRRSRGTRNHEHAPPSAAGDCFVTGPSALRVLVTGSAMRVLHGPTEQPVLGTIVGLVDEVRAAGTASGTVQLGRTRCASCWTATAGWWSAPSPTSRRQRMLTVFAHLPDGDVAAVRCLRCPRRARHHCRASDARKPRRASVRNRPRDLRQAGGDLRSDRRRALGVGPPVEYWHPVGRVPRGAAAEPLGQGAAAPVHRDGPMIHRDGGRAMSWAQWAAFAIGVAVGALLGAVMPP